MTQIATFATFRRAVLTGLLSASLLASAQAAVAQTQCNQTDLSGTWTAALDDDYICSLRIRNGGAFTGTCTEDRGDEYNVRGRFTLRATCALSARIEFIGERQVYAGTGRVWGTATTRPDVGMAVSDTPRNYWQLQMFRQP